MKYKPLLLSCLLLASCGGSAQSSTLAVQSSEKAIGSSAAQTSESEAKPIASSSIEENTQESEKSAEESQQAYALNLKVASPAGAPSVALYRHIKESEDKLEINADPTAVVAYLSANSGKDIVIAPTNAGLSAIAKKGAPFKIAATLTFGNFYLASTGNDENKTLDPDDYVVAFQKNNVPDKIFSYVYSDLTNVHYVNAATDAAAALISKKNVSDDNADVDYVLMAEPALTNALSKNPDASQYTDIQAEFNKKSGGMDITQASIFVANSAEKTKVDAFLSSIKADVASFLDTPSVIDSFIEGMDASVLQSKFSSPVAAIKKLTSEGNRMGLGYKEASSNKEAVKTFASLFGITDIADEVFYQ